ncbi:MAG: hypothetical protein ABF753_03290 [Lentilactobacillus hilgardii]|jgi:hypothetical protein|nr:hypothetical protein [Lentilactobacillus buchneri]
MLKKHVYRVIVWEDDDPTKAHLGNIGAAIKNFFYRHELNCEVRKLKR